MYFRVEYISMIQLSTDFSSIFHLNAYPTTVGKRNKSNTKSTNMNKRLWVSTKCACRLISTIMLKLEKQSGEEGDTNPKVW
jgi:hypothetical protein